MGCPGSKSGWGDVQGKHPFHSAVFLASVLYFPELCTWDSHLSHYSLTPKVKINENLQIKHIIS